MVWAWPNLVPAGSDCWLSGKEASCKFPGKSGSNSTLMETNSYTHRPLRWLATLMTKIYNLFQDWAKNKTPRTVLIAGSPPPRPRTYPDECPTWLRDHCWCQQPCDGRPRARTYESVRKPTPQNSTACVIQERASIDVVTVLFGFILSEDMTWPENQQGGRLEMEDVLHHERPLCGLKGFYMCTCITYID